MCVESTGGFPSPEPSRVVVHGDGRAEVFVGSTPTGQGHETFLAQVAADRLGWPLDRITVSAGDSRNVPFAGVTAGSRSALEVGNSVALSAAAARRQLLDREADALEAAAEDIEVGVDGAVVRGAPGRGVPLEKLIGEGLEAVEAWTSKGPAWASSCHVAVVRVDLETGGVEMQRYVIAHDSGRPINPLLLDGQLHGGYVHGLGYALFEECVYSEGRFVGPSFLDYTIASAPELKAEPELIHTETPTSQNPEGVRGAGEAGTIAVPAAVANAVEDALYAAGRPVEVEMVPITPLRLWELLQP
jgi:carbon-monoxide dehydrogenase large subunit